MSFFLFTLHEQQSPSYNRLASGAAADPAAPAPAQLLPAFYQGGLVATPAGVRAQLSDRQVALWPVPGASAWALSTQLYTGLVGGAGGPEIDLLTVLPAKGGGAMQLYAGSLRLFDAYTSTALKQLAAALEAQAKAKVNPLQRSDY